MSGAEGFLQRETLVEKGLLRLDDDGNFKKIYRSTRNEKKAQFMAMLSITN